MDRHSIEIRNDIAELPRLNEFLARVSGLWGLSGRLSMNINLVLEEIVTNIFFYGYTDNMEHVISISMVREEGGISLIITDDGKPFDLSAAAEFEGKHKEASEREPGGLGIHFVRSMMDRISYRRENGKNILELFKDTGNKD